MYFRGIKKSAGDVSISDPVESDKDGNPLTLMDLMADDMNVADLIDRQNDSEQLKKAILRRLSPREQTIICLRYGMTGGRPLTQREIAKKLQISRSYVSRIEKKALELLRDELAEKI
ncbi:MAG TPA: sigma-70 family RNA polymerase sigma factor [Candidatus Merdivicinus intestinigallinarum]|nr:sigma-70 family RNA polymerase sigma factor [Candidatus Merdivicinus intestinigallinarum]